MAAFGLGAYEGCPSYVRAMSVDATAAEPPGGLFYERVLLPHRSLPPRGFHVMIGLLGLLSLGVSIGFVSVGAWPICGFFGLDVAASSISPFA